MSKALNVLFLMEDLCFGGTQRQTLELARRLDRTCFIPSMLTLTGETDLDATAREAGIALRHMGTSRRVAPFFFLRLGRALLRAAPGYLGALHGLAQPSGDGCGAGTDGVGRPSFWAPVVEADLLSASMSVFSGD